MGAKFTIQKDVMPFYLIKTLVIIFLSLVSLFSADAQFTRQDTLRGSVGKERAWWNVLRYDLSIKPDYNKKRIEGYNIITFETKNFPDQPVMQIDLQEPMSIDSILYQEKHKLDFKKDGNAWFVTLLKHKPGPAKLKLKIFFSGKPREATNPPWDGGWIWEKDAKGRPWMTVACQGLGASAWYPCKDHQGDEPDEGATLSINAPDSLVAVGNGRLIKKQTQRNRSITWTWEVKNPINNYNIVPYIGKYVNWAEKYKGVKANLDCSFWVMDYNLDKAKRHFGRDTKPMLHCFEDWFGPYPFYSDGFKLVETPHLGMEHQSGIAYGNQFLNGYLGSDLSSTGWGTKFDFIIIHESGHEWFGNNITTKDIADMWVHEGFTNYSEVLFVECQFGRKAADEYCQGLRAGINNDSPVIGTYGVNREGSGDMYPKGANLIHTIRQVINNDIVFKSILRGLNRDFYHQTISSKDLESYIIHKSGKDLSKIFDQYLRDTRIPELQYKITDGRSMTFRWSNCIPGFNMPIKVSLGERQHWLKPTTEWQTIRLADWYDGRSFYPDKNYYITFKNVDE